jgi:hypothetical protein
MAGDISGTVFGLRQNVVTQRRTAQDKGMSKYRHVTSINKKIVSLIPGLNLNSVNQLIFVMVKCGVLFEVRTEFLNNI